MERRTHLWLVTFLVISLAFPIYSMGDMKLNLMTDKGYPLTSNIPVIKSFFIDTENNLTVILQDPLIFQDLNPQIVVSSSAEPEGGNCTVSAPWDGSVTAQVAASGTKTIGFTVSTPTGGASMSSSGSIVPEGATYTSSGNTGTFSWPITPENVGRYLAVFQATGVATSQIVVMIRIDPPETLTTPETPSGPTNGVINTMYTYSTIGATSSVGDTVQYKFIWGDGTTSGWINSTSAKKSWSKAGNYSVMVRARCQTHTGVISTLSSALSVTISSGGGGLLGSKTNPIPLNKIPGPGYLYPSIGGGSSGSEIRVSSGKVYFLFDPSPSTIWAQVIIKGYGNIALKYWKQVQTKAGNDVGAEVTIRNNQGDGLDTPTNLSTARFLYAVEGTGTIDIFVQHY